MSLVVYNTLSKQKEKFEPHDPKHVKMYCCGPTVYGLLHVGNFRGPIFYNLVRNWLEHIGYKVTFVYNYTDVDDKIINRANEEKVTAKEVAEKYISEFEKDYGRLKLRKHDRNPRVSDHMNDIKKMVAQLISKEKAYAIGGDVLFSIKSFPEYGKLSHRNPDDLKTGVRIEVDQKKKDPLDFALWKGAKAGEPAWESDWGPGRPGWHIECSAMSHAILGEQIDIHGGGMDLVFPHHENEIAQSEGCFDKAYVKYWLHNNMLNFSGTKMSKSLGNIISARSFMDEYNPEIFKYMILSVHYRSVTDFGENAVDQAVHALGRIYSAVALADSLYKEGDAVTADEKLKKATAEAWANIEMALNDDFNTPEAFARVFEIVRLFNSQVKRGIKTNPAVAGKAKEFKDFISKFGSLMSLFQEPASAYLTTLDNMLLGKMNLERSVVDQVIAERAAARAAKDFKKSDELRDKLSAMKISVSDTADGSFWEVMK